MIVLLAWACIGIMFHSDSVGTVFGGLGIHTVALVFRRNETYSSLLVICVWLLVVQGTSSILCMLLWEAMAGRASVAWIA